MAASSAAPFFSPPPPLSFILNPKPLYILASHKSISPFHAPILIFPSKTLSSRIRSYNLNFPKTTKCWKLCATDGVSTPVESSQQIVSASGDGVSNIISALLFIAFIGLSILTVGVIYIAVTDYLQKRERERFEKEEASKKKKKSGKKGKVRARARGGPRGFGMKIEEDDDDDAVGAD